MFKRLLQYFLNFLISFLINIKDKMSNTQNILLRIYGNCFKNSHTQFQKITICFNGDFLSNKKENLCRYICDDMMINNQKVDPNTFFDFETKSHREYILDIARLHQSCINSFISFVLHIEQNIFSAILKGDFEDLFGLIVKNHNQTDKYKKNWREFILRIINGLEVNTTPLYYNFSSTNRILAISQLREIEQFIREI